MQNLIIQDLIKLKNTNLYVGSYIIPLYGKRKTLKLIQVMLEQKNGVSRAELRHAIYQEDAKKTPSFRLKDAQDASLSKLISRSRRMLKFSLSDTPWDSLVNWIVYNDKNKNWMTVTLKKPTITPLDFSSSVHEADFRDDATPGTPAECDLGPH